MQRHNSYPYGFGPVAAVAQQPPRYGGVHGTSSAQSPSANPDEDWTKISDLAERRRIQNRIAQRNYRKKLKRRLEDLERRAGSSSASPEQKPAELVSSQAPAARKEELKKRRSSKPGVLPPKANARSPIPPAQAAFGGREESNMFAKQYTRQLSASPPPALTYSYGGPSDGIPALQHPYPQHAPYPTLPAPTYSDYPSASPVYLPPLPMGRAYDGVKPEYEDDLMNNFHFSYASAQGIDAPASSHGFDAASYAVAPPPPEAYGLGPTGRAPSPSQVLPFPGVGAHPVLGF